MNEEELFCKLFPEYAVNRKPLSPYFDLFESGYEQAEKHIEELKLKLEALEGKTPWKDIKDKSEVIGKLTNAKELLKMFVHHYKTKTIYIENMQDLLEQAEQFLSEVEK